MKINPQFKAEAEKAGLNLSECIFFAFAVLTDRLSFALERGIVNPNNHDKLKNYFVNRSMEDLDKLELRIPLFANETNIGDWKVFYDKIVRGVPADKQGRLNYSKESKKEFFDLVAQGKEPSKLADAVIMYYRKEEFAKNLDKVLREHVLGYYGKTHTSDGHDL